MSSLSSRFSLWWPQRGCAARRWMSIALQPRRQCQDVLVDETQCEGPLRREALACVKGTRRIRSMIRRRTFTAGVAALLAAPSISRGAANAPLKFIPQSDLTILDPIVTTVYTARNHGYMVFDTLFGMDSAYKIQPQMLEGFTVEDDGKRWRL